MRLWRRNSRLTRLPPGRADSGTAGRGQARWASATATWRVLLQRDRSNTGNDSPHRSVSRRWRYRNGTGMPEHGLRPVPRIQAGGHVRWRNSKPRTPYLYSSYEHRQCESAAYQTRTRRSSFSAAVPTALGRASSSTTCCCHAVLCACSELPAMKRGHSGQLQPGDGQHRLRPTSDRLYFEPLTLRGRHANIVERERRSGTLEGVIVTVRRADAAQFSAPVCRKQACPLHGYRRRKQSTCAEDRDHFGALAGTTSKYPAPADTVRPRAVEEAVKVASERIGYPVDSATHHTYWAGAPWPSWTMSRMNCGNYMVEAVAVSSGQARCPHRPVPGGCRSKFDVDAICDGEQRCRGRHHAAHRRGRHPQRRQLRRASPLQDHRRRDPHPARLHLAHRPGAGRGGLVEHPVRQLPRHGIRAGNQPPRLAHRALPGKGHRPGPGPRGHPLHDGAFPGAAGRGGGAGPRAGARQGPPCSPSAASP